jgi:hypothetical protein
MVMPVDEAWPLRIAREHMPAKRIPDQHSLRIGRSPSLLRLEFDTFDDLDINSPAFSAFALKKKYKQTRKAFPFLKFCNEMKNVERGSALETHLNHL